MTRNLFSGAALLMALLGYCVGRAPEVCEKGGPPDPALVPLYVATGRTVIPLNQDGMATVASGKNVDVRVMLTATAYECKLFEETDELFERLGRFLLYELKGDRTYAWALWSWTALGNFRLFSGGYGENYLAWVEGSTVRFAEVSESREAPAAFRDDLSGEGLPGIVRVPVDELIPGSAGWELKAPYNDIRVQSIEKGDDGEWVVKISGPDTDQVYTLVSQKGEWHRKKPPLLTHQH